MSIGWDWIDWQIWKYEHFQCNVPSNTCASNGWSNLMQQLIGLISRLFNYNQLSFPQGFMDQAETTTFMSTCTCIYFETANQPRDK